MIKFKLFNIQVQINFLFVALVTLLLLTDKSNFAIKGLVACLMHEMGHIVAFFMVGATPKSLSFEINGIRLQETDNSLSRGRELFVLFAGSFINLLMFLIIGSDNIWAIIHLTLGIFNLLPLSGLDGGKILMLISSFFLPILWAEKICSATNFIFMALLIFVCILGFFITKNNFTLLIMAIYSIMKIIHTHPRYNLKRSKKMKRTEKT